MSLSEPLANAQLELGRSQVIKLGEEMAVVIGEGHTRMAGPAHDLRGIDTRGRDQSDSGVLQVMIMPMSA